ncbi:MAG: class I SAM-dependent methyltransferase, partial [Spirochaetaceae bacterium]|nr:class I SAM-dependent methyltransferase [Spirochaetaceae bacterium]
MSDFSDEINNVYTVLSKNMGKGSLLEIRRLLHGRGGTWEGCSFLNVDFFPPALLITLYEERNDLWKDTLSELLLKHDSISVVVFQDRSRVPWTNRVLGGVLPDPHIVEENHLKYSVSLKRGENPGIFPDMRDGRSYVREISKGKKVLNLFSYTCAFSVAAVEGGALSVLNMDMNSNSLSRGRENHQLNHHEKSKVNYLSHNILKSFGKIRKSGPFDLV